MKLAGAFLLLTLAAVSLLAAPARAAAQEGGDGGADAGVTLVLVRSWSWEEARPAAEAAEAAGRGVAAGFVSTLPADAELGARVLALAVGEPVETRALAAGTGPAQVAEFREDNPDAALTGLVPTRVLVDLGMEVAGLMAIPAGGTAAAGAVPDEGELVPEAGELLVLGVADAERAQVLLGRLHPEWPVLLAGLEPTPGRARTAPFLRLGGPGAEAGLVTSDSTRRDGLVAPGDVRATVHELAGARGDSPVGSPVRVAERDGALDAAAALDRQAAALTTAKPWAVAAAVLIGGIGINLALVARATGGDPTGRRARTARAWLLVTVAIPAGYLVASWLAPPQPAVWVGAGVAAAALLAAAAAPARGAAPGVLGVLLLVLVTADLASGGAALARPLVSGGAFDGVRFYGIGNGTFGYALAGVVCAGAFLPLGRAGATALLVLLALVAGLPALGANVGGALTAMLTAAAAWLLLGRRPLRPAPVLAAAAAAVAAGLAVALAVGALTGNATHGTGFLERVTDGGPAAALRVFAHRLELNLELLTGPFGWVGPALIVFAAVAALARPLGLREADPSTLGTLQAGVVGALALVALNDSGVTAAIGCGLLLLSGFAWALVPPPGAVRVTGTNDGGLAALARLSGPPSLPGTSGPSATPGPPAAEP